MLCRLTVYILAVCLSVLLSSLDDVFIRRKLTAFLVFIDGPSKKNFLAAHDSGTPATT